jgi:WD40 repeat protein/tRNA A-37 threonylcarbamoyl transferase component Bud32
MIALSREFARRPRRPAQPEGRRRMAGPGCISEANLRAFLLGELPERVGQAISSHLETCRDCEAAARRLDGLTDPIIDRLRKEFDPGVVGELSTLVEPAVSEQQRPISVASPRFGVGYEILEEVGRGGVSVVYRARQTRPARDVALKVLLAGSHADAERRARFLAEADAFARLRHPNIVPIHEVGEHDGLPFLALEYVEGGSLAGRLGGVPLPPREAAALVEQLAKAVHFAHRNGVIHRDLKPANILIAADGTPKITDFGLAKQEQSGLTATGVVLGTPSYMAPEQAEGKAREVGPAADVYALGAILYELLTGRPPFRGATPMETLEQVRAHDPVPPGRLQGRMPRELDTVCLKCLQKEPASRYDSAQALADDLRRFLGGEPILARPVKAWERTVKWAKRRPVIAALILVVQFLLSALFVTGIWSYLEISRSLAIAQRRAEDLAWQDYINRVNLAYAEVQDDNVERAKDLLHGCLPDRRGWEWHYVKRLCHLERLTLESAGPCVNAVGFSPDGTWMALGASERLFVMNTMENAEVQLELRDVSTGQIRQVLRGLKGVVTSVAVSPDGARIAVGGRFHSPASDCRLAVWDVASSRIAWIKADPERTAMGVAFSPEGKFLAVGFGGYQSGDTAGYVQICETITGGEMLKFTGPIGGVNRLAFHPDGRRIAVAGSGVVEIRDVIARTRVCELRGHTRWVLGLAFSPDGRRLATAGWDRTIQLWNVATAKVDRTLFAHNGPVLDLAFSPDGRCLASAGEDRSIKLWDVVTGRNLATLHGHEDYVQSVSFRPDGLELATGSLDGTMKVWNLETSRPVVFDEHTGWVERLAFRRDGRRVRSEVGLFGSREDRAKTWDPITGKADSVADEDPRRARPIPFEAGSRYGGNSASSPDGKLVARIILESQGYNSPRSRGYAGKTVEIREVATGRILQTLMGHTADITCMAFSPDGRRLATASYDKTIKLWDVLNGLNVFTLRGHTAGVISLAFSPDGYRLASGSMDFTARIWDAAPLPPDTLRLHEAGYRRKQRRFAEQRDPQDERQRAEILALEGRWGLASESFGRAVEREPANLHLRYHHVLSLLESGDLVGYRRACASIVARFGTASDPDLAHEVAWDCVLAADAVDDREIPVRLARTALASFSGNMKHFAHNTLGAALYRAGRFAESIIQLNQSIEVTGGGGYPQDWVYLAMAHHRLGHRNESRHWLDRLLEYEKGRTRAFSWDEIEIGILCREVQSTMVMPSNPENREQPASSAHQRDKSPPVAAR